MIPETQLHLSLQIAEHGIDAHHADVVRYVRELRREGRRGVLLDVCADPGQPAVARERAFGRLVAWLARTPANTAGTEHEEHEEHEEREECPTAA